MNLVLIQRFCSSFVVKTLKRFKTGGKVPKTTMKVFLQKRNPLTGNTEWDVGVDHEEYDYNQEIARSAFADMLHDTERNKMYYRALQLAIQKMHQDGKKANVLDIGTGTGLLSMMAAKCGADTITACEAFKPMADCCLKILACNGFADRIKVIPKRSTEITVGENGDMAEKANILVTEVFDTELIGEGALSTFSHAHKFLLEKDCIVVPDSAVVYAQVVECPFLQKWNKLEDLVAPELDLVLKTPQKMKDCAGSAAVHDIQLSQVPRSSFHELSDKIPVFYYDWSGKTSIVMNRMVKQEFTVAMDGTAQMIFMWWELNMDTEGKIVLSCAPWWNHPNASISSERPEDTIPWRDHWMQAVYYLPQETPVKKNSEINLVSCQDEYSFWFYLENGDQTRELYKRPICECGVHMVWSRTHVFYINNKKQSRRIRNQLRREIKDNAVVLDLNGTTLLGLIAAKMAKKVYIHEESQLNIDILQEYMTTNNIKNVEIIRVINEEILRTVTNVIFDPIQCFSIYPWENLKAAHILLKYREHLRADVSIFPKAFELFAMPVEFLNLQKIRLPVRQCEGFDMSIFDNIVEKSRKISDDVIEVQPLWEYPCLSSGLVQKLLYIDFNDLKSKYVGNSNFTVRRRFSITDEPEIPVYPVNGFALWVEWDLGDELQPTFPEVRERVHWEPHTRQAVKLLDKTYSVLANNEWCYQVECDLENGHFNVNVDLIEIK